LTKHNKYGIFFDMSENQNQPENHNASPPRQPFGRGIAAFVAGAALAGAVGGGLAHEAGQRNDELQDQLNEQGHTLTKLVDTVSKLNGVTAKELTGQGLRSVKELPGFGHEVKPEDSELFRSATVKIVKRARNGNDNWYESCSGLKVNIGNDAYVATAGHCFTPAFNKGGGSDSDPSTGRGLARNIKNADPNEYAVALPDAAGTHYDSVDVSPVSDISWTFINDVALLRITKDATQAFTSTPAVPYEKYYDETSKPVAGESVKVFALPSAAFGKTLTGEGKYLGRIEMPDDGRTVDVVGLTNATTAAEDACNYGASGSIAVTASGHATGPLSFRNSSEFKPNAPVNGSDDISADTIRRLKMQELTGVDMTEFKTVCEYAVPSEGMLTQLLAGFKDIAPAAKPGDYQSMK
jgi:hypothetical protein